MDKFKGTGVAIVTPFKNDSSIDFRSLGQLVKHLINNNIDYLVVLGSTGESVTQSKEL
jgi:4-hydroxy-tetrahydrodipicolinate synthase